MKTNRGIIALIITVLIWGSTLVVTKSALNEIGPLSLAVLRFLIGLLLLVPLAWRRGYRFRLSLRPTFLTFGLTGVALFYGLQNLGLLYTSAVSSTLVLAVIPAVTALLAAWLLDERPGPLRIVGIALALLGAGTVALGDRAGTQAPNPMLGNLLIGGSVLSWAAYTVQGKRLTTSYSALITTTASMVAGTLILLPFAAAELWLVGTPDLSRGGWLALLYLGLIATALPMFLWNEALHHVPANLATLYLNLVPVVGVALALFTGEEVYGLQLLGGALALLGVWISGRPRPRRASPEGPVAPRDERRFRDKTEPVQEG